MTSVKLWLLPIVAGVSISGCSTTPLTTTKQPMAMNYALNRARFEMACPSATGQVLGSEVIQPALNGLPRFSGPQRAQFTIGVTGCDKRQTMVVLCADDTNGCFSADGQ